MKQRKGTSHEKLFGVPHVDHTQPNQNCKSEHLYLKCYFHLNCILMNFCSFRQCSFEWVCWAGVTISILSPHLMYRELQAFRYCFFQGHAGYPDTLIGTFKIIENLRTMQQIFFLLENYRFDFFIFLFPNF